MAALAGPLIEAAAARALVALGAGVAAGAAGEAARKRQKEAEEARSTPIARADAQTKAKEKCKDCAPDKGAPYLRNTAGWSDDSITYQMRIAQMPPARAGFLTEWDFAGVKFDGFISGECLLKEAKARYDQFFNASGAPQKWWDGDDPIFVEASKQSAVAKPMPPVQLRWYFMQPMSYRYFSRAFVKMLLPIETVYQP